MNKNETRLKDAGIREQEWAQQHLMPLLPPAVTFADVMEHGVYDARMDTVSMTVKAVTFSLKVDRP